MWGKKRVYPRPHHHTNKDCIYNNHFYTNKVSRRAFFWCSCHYLGLLDAAFSDRLFICCLLIFMYFIYAQQIFSHKVINIIFIGEIAVIHTI